MKNSLQTINAVFHRDLTEVLKQVKANAILYIAVSFYYDTLRASLQLYLKAFAVACGAKSSSTVGLAPCIHARELVIRWYCDTATIRS